MIKFYLKTALRNLLRNRTHTFINLLGLSLGIACALIVFLIVSFNLSFDNYHKESENIYRVVTLPEFSGEIFHNAGVAYSVPNMLTENFPQISQMTKVKRYGRSNVIWTYNNQQGNSQEKKVEIKNLASVSLSYFDIFNVDWKIGIPSKAFTSKKSIVLSEKLATEIFGNANPIGQILYWDDKYEIEVTGVISNPPLNSNLAFNAYTSYELIDDKPEHEIFTNVSDSDQCFIKLSVADPTSLKGKINELYTEKIKTDRFANNWELGLQPLTNIHFNPNFGTPTGNIANQRLLWALVAIGIFLVITACINYINLSTALSVGRSKEVGIRKVMGSRKSSLVGQFLGETMLLTLLALLLSLGITELFMLNLNSFINLGVEIDLLHNALFSSYWVYLFLFVILGITTLAAGFYPAMVMSSFSPIDSLKNSLSNKTRKGLILRRVLVIFQFMLSQVLIVGTLVVLSQIDFINDKDLGFEQSAVVGMSLPFKAEYSKKETFRERSSRIAGVKAAALSNSPAFSQNRNSQDITINNGNEKIEKHADVKQAEPDFLSIYNIELLAGRPFTANDTMYEVVVNEQFLKIAGIASPQEALNSDITFTSLDGDPYPIVGVVRDFHMRSLHDQIQPLFIGSANNNMFFLNLKVDPNQWQSTRFELEKIWKESFPEEIFDPHFLDDKLEDYYKEEQRTLRLFNLFAGLAIFISCLGLYGLVSFLAIQKTKEVGIRKVLGASITNIVMLFSMEFVKLLVIALLISIPIAWWLMEQWLEDFAYRIDIDYNIFIVAGVTALLISLLTISFRSIKAAMANPANSLRNE